MDVRGTIVIQGRGCHSFGAGCLISVSDSGTLYLGNNFACTGDTMVYVNKEIVIGDDNMWSYNNVVMDNDGHQIMSDGICINNSKNVFFGRKVWLGCGCTILKGTHIPDGTIIAASSKIQGNYDKPCCIITDNKKILKENITWIG